MEEALAGVKWTNAGYSVVRAFSFPGPGPGGNHPRTLDEQKYITDARTSYL